MIIYLHGFNSSPASGKAEATRQYCLDNGIDIEVPALPHRPAEAIELARQLCAGHESAAVIGSSLGGYYSTWLVENGHAARGVLINPAVEVAPKLAGEVGRRQTNYHTEQTYELTEQHIDELHELEIARVARPASYLLMVQQGDEILDYREAVEYYAGATQIVEPGGDHGFAGYDRHLPAIIEFIQAG